MNRDFYAMSFLFFYADEYSLLNKLLTLQSNPFLKVGFLKYTPNISMEIFEILSKKFLQYHH